VFKEVDVGLVVASTLLFSALDKLLHRDAQRCNGSSYLLQELKGVIEKNSLATVTKKVCIYICLYIHSIYTVYIVVGENTSVM